VRKSSKPQAATRAKLGSRPKSGSRRLRSPDAVGEASAYEAEDKTNFRFFDNRQKYLLFVNTCSEKWVIAERVARELDNISPRPPAVRVFDAGVGDGTVLARVMRAMHARFPTMPFYVTGKEISLEDIRLALERMPERFLEHPATVLVLTNLYYSEAPWLRPNTPAAARDLVWADIALKGDSAHAFGEQITGLQPFLSEVWTAHSSEKTGNPLYDRPVVLVLYREDHRFLLDSVIPRRGEAAANYDLIIASQPYRARPPVEFKVRNVVMPLARALGRGGRLIGIHSRGGDPGLEIIHHVWPDENPFRTTRHEIVQETQKSLGRDGRDLSFDAMTDSRSIFRYHMHTLPNELAGSIGTSTLFAAWNAAIYVAQIEDRRVAEAFRDSRFLAATDTVLKKRGGLWFFDESYVISRKA
jgi:hypothetical protein